MITINFHKLPKASKKYPPILKYLSFQYILIQISLNIKYFNSVNKLFATINNNFATIFSYFEKNVYFSMIRRSIKKH